MKEFSIPSAGKGNLHCCKWEPDGEVRGVVQLVHGIAEYTARYEALAQVLTKQGYVVVGEDHMGHGGSISEDTLRGHFYGGWLNAVDDTYSLLQKTKTEYPGKPYFLYGHSMGSFIARTILYRYPDAGLAGALISGTGWQPGLVLNMGIALCGFKAKIHGDTFISMLVGRMMFGGYVKGYENPRTPLDWLSSDSKVVDAYIDDPLCGFDSTVGLLSAMMKGMRMNQKRRNLAKMPKALPVYFFAGDMDPVGNNGRGVLRTVRAFDRAKMQDVSVKIYPQGRHEMHNEMNKEEVYEDVLNFLGEHS